MISFILNVPWTLFGLLAAIISIPMKFSISSKPRAFVIHVRSLWWYAWLPGYAKVRAMAVGNVVLLSPRADEKDLAHELIHVGQYGRFPLIFPIMYIIEEANSGSGMNNQWELGAYEKSGSRYES